MDWEELKNIGTAALITKQWNIYKQAWQLYNNSEYEKALEQIKRVTQRIILRGMPAGIPKIELNLAKGLIFYELEDYKNSINFLTKFVNDYEIKGAQNDTYSCINVLDKIHLGYYYLGKAYWFSDFKKEGDNFIIKGYNLSKDNLNFILELAFYYAVDKNIENSDFYTNEVCKTYTKENSNHRKHIHNYVNKYEKLWRKNTTYYERFLRILKSNNLIDEYTIISKLGEQSYKQNGFTKNLTEQVLQLIIKDDVSSALDLLLKNSKDKPTIFNTLMILFNNYNKVKMEIRTGIIDKTEENIILNKIKVKILELVSNK